MSAYKIKVNFWQLIKEYTFLPLLLLFQLQYPCIRLIVNMKHTPFFVFHFKNICNNFYVRFWFLFMMILRFIWNVREKFHIKVLLVSLFHGRLLKKKKKHSDLCSYFYYTSRNFMPPQSSSKWTWNYLLFKQVIIVTLTNI